MNPSSESVDIIINGEAKSIRTGLMVTDLVSDLQLAPERIAIEYNRAILARRLWAETQLNEGDSLEIVHFVGGG